MVGYDIVALDKTLLSTEIHKFLNENICCGCSLEASHWDASNEQTQKNIFMKKQDRTT